MGGYDAVTGLPSGGLLDEFRLYNRALPDAEVLSTWNFSLPKDFGTLAGTVTNSYNGTPIAGAIVTCGTQNATTIANGTYSISNVPVGNYNVSCSATGFLPQTKPATITKNQTTTLNFALNPIPAVCSGVVTNAATGAPVVGAKVSVGTNVTYSTGPTGAYALNIYPAVTNVPVLASKAGFDNFSSAPMTFTPPNTSTLNIPLLETTNAPVNVVATLNTPQTAVDITWGLPTAN